MVRLIMPVFMFFMLGGVVFISSSWADKDSVGKAVFETQCAACHGSEGVGTGMLKPLKGSEFLGGATDADMKKIILEGTSEGMIPMPPMGDKLNKKELEAVVEYIKNLK